MKTVFKSSSKIEKLQFYFPVPEQIFFSIEEFRQIIVETEKSFDVQASGIVTEIGSTKSSENWFNVRRPKESY